MNDAVRLQLRDILTRHGTSVCDEPRRLRALLADLCPEESRETHVLAAALEQGIVRELLTASDAVPWTMLRARLARQLHDDLAMEETAARWTVESWALALGKIRPDQLTPDCEPVPEESPAAHADRGIRLLPETDTRRPVRSPSPPLFLSAAAPLSPPDTPEPSPHAYADLGHLPPQQQGANPYRSAHADTGTAGPSQQGHTLSSRSQVLLLVVILVSVVLAIVGTATVLVLIVFLRNPARPAREKETPPQAKEDKVLPQPVVAKKRKADEIPTPAPSPPSPPKKTAGEFRLARLQDEIRRLDEAIDMLDEAIAAPNLEIKELKGPALTRKLDEFNAKTARRQELADRQEELEQQLAALQAATRPKHLEKKSPQTGGDNP
jgi:hypothetical protein